MINEPPRNTMFENPVDSIDQLDEDEFAALIYALDWAGDEYEELYEEEPKQWVIEWSKFLETGNVYALSDFDPVWTSLNWIGDPRSNQFWLYIEHSDGTFLGDKIDTAGKALTSALLWSPVHEDLESIGDSILYGIFEINAEWVPQSAIKTYLEDLMQKSKLTHLKGGTGPTLTDWLAEQYSK